MLVMPNDKGTEGKQMQSANSKTCETEENGDRIEASWKSSGRSGMGVTIRRFLLLLTS